MGPTRVLIHHSEPISRELPKRWTRYWTEVLSRKAKAVYTALRKEIFDGEMVDVRMLAAELSMSRTAFWLALEELQEYGFCAVDEGMD
jgi:hypothetical protein